MTKTARAGRYPGDHKVCPTRYSLEKCLSVRRVFVRRVVGVMILFRPVLLLVGDGCSVGFSCSSV